MSFTWPSCGVSNYSRPPCTQPGWGLGGRCELHGGVATSPKVCPLVILGELRGAFDLGGVPPSGPARVFVVTERVWVKLAKHGDWPLRWLPENDLHEPERDARGNRRGKRGRGPQPTCLEPGEGGWPQTISGRIARQLCRRPGAVSRIIATTEFTDGWWLRSLLTRNMTADEAASVNARVELRWPGETELGAVVEASQREAYERAIALGLASWT
jgi:hypothetical protein